MSMYPHKSRAELNVLIGFLGFSGHVDVKPHSRSFSAQTIAAVREVFKVFDVDNSQSVSMEEIERIMGDALADMHPGSKSSDHLLRIKFVEEACKDLPKIEGGPNHGHLDFDGFLAFMGPSYEDT